MKTGTTIVPFATLLLALVLALPLAAEGPAPKKKILFEFTTQEVERDGAEMRVKKKYGYSFGDWQDKITFLEGRGLLVPYLPGAGGFGGDRSMKLAEFAAVELLAVIGNRNEAEGFGLTLIDADGTEATWYLPLAGKPRGTDVVYRLDLAQCDKEEKPGKVAGLDKAKIRKWQIKGNWQTRKAELLVVRLSAAP